jgi:GT2 family glycosyltransferase
MGHLRETTYVRWLHAVVYARKVLEEYTFDEWFKGYGYLEDLDLSYRVGKQYKLAVVQGARFYHYPSPLGRTDPYLFGKKEIVNRLYFVRKHKELSPASCCLALGARALITACVGIQRRESCYFRRLAGNLAGLLFTLGTGLKPVT